MHRYDKVSGLFINSYSSIKEASEDTGVCYSNISMCCRGHAKTAGDYIWSFEKKSSVEVPIDKRKKLPAIPPTPEELQARRLKFIKDNQE